MKSRRKLSPAFARRILAWFDQGQRDLPWRKLRDPYAIWISEVMLQQTQVTTVIPYFRKWLVRFPDVSALASATENDVLDAWQGLGYYSRARTLHRAAWIVVDRFGGKLPETRELLRELPGFGPYTSGAVASIAFGEAVPAVDGNVARVVSRILKLPGHSGDTGLRENVSLILATTIPRKRPGDFNQALMELGATVCRPQSPRCGDCPVSALCSSNGKISIPRRKPRKAIELHWTAFLCSGPSGNIIYRKRPEAGLFGGLWELPTLEKKSAPSGGKLLGEIEHKLTHRTIHLRVYEVKRLPDNPGWKELMEWQIPPPISALSRKALALAGQAASG